MQVVFLCLNVASASQASKCDKLDLGSLFHQYCEQVKLVLRREQRPANVTSKDGTSTPHWNLCAGNANAYILARLAGKPNNCGSKFTDLTVHPFKWRFKTPKSYSVTFSQIKRSRKSCPLILLKKRLWVFITGAFPFCLLPIGEKLMQGPPQAASSKFD